MGGFPVFSINCWRMHIRGACWEKALGDVFFFGMFIVSILEISGVWIVYVFYFKLFPHNPLDVPNNDLFFKRYDVYQCL